MPDACCHPDRPLELALPLRIPAAFLGQPKSFLPWFDEAPVDSQDGLPEYR